MKTESSMCLYTKQPDRRLLQKAAGPLLFAAVAGLTFYTIFHTSGAADILPALRSMKISFLLAAAAAAVFFVSAEGMMIWYLLHAVNRRVRVGQCIRYSFIGFFYSGITPSATGGQPMQLYYMNRDGIDAGDATAVLMGVATAYKFILAVLGAGMLLFWRNSLTMYLGGYMALYDLGLFLNILLVVLLLGLMCGDGTRRLLLGAERLLVRIRLLRPSAKRVQSLEKMAESYRETVRFFLNRKGKIVVILAVTLLQRSSLFFLTWLIYRGLNLSGDSIWLIMGLQAAVTIAVDMLPLPGAQGISEVLYYSVFAGIIPVGLLIPSMCAARGISFYFLLLISACVAGCCYLSGIRKEKKQRRSNGL